MYIKFFVAIFLVNVSFGMQNVENSIEKVSMVKINSFEEMKTFAGRIVVYQTYSSNIGVSDGYKIHGHDVGLVSSSVELRWHDEFKKILCGYELICLTSKSSIASSCFLCDQVISEGLSIRKVTEEEMKSIHSAVKGKNAKFSIGHSKISTKIIGDFQSFNK